MYNRPVLCTEKGVEHTKTFSTMKNGGKKEMIRIERWFESYPEYFKFLGFKHQEWQTFSFRNDTEKFSKFSNIFFFIMILR